MKCQHGEGKGRAGQRVLGAGQEGHSAPSSWSFLLLSGPVTSFQSKASLTQQAEEGRKAKQLRCRSASPVLPWVAGFVLLLPGCSHKSYKQQVRHGKIFLQRLWALAFTCVVQGPGRSQQLTSKRRMRGWERSQVAEEGARTAGRCAEGREEEEPSTSFHAASPQGLEMDACSAGWQGDAEPGCRQAQGSGVLSSAKRCMKAFAVQDSLPPAAAPRAGDWDPPLHGQGAGVRGSPPPNEARWPTLRCSGLWLFGS